MGAQTKKAPRGRGAKDSAHRPRARESHSTAAAKPDGASLRARLPAELVGLDAWCVSLPDKEPANAGGRPVDVFHTNPGLTFDGAAEAAGRIDGAGVGLCFTGTPYAGIDLDGCFDGADELREWARPIVAAALRSGCYVERSGSRSGLHIIGRLEEDVEPRKTKASPPGAGEHEGIETFVKRGYFRLTGDRFDGGDA